MGQYNFKILPDHLHSSRTHFPYPKRKNNIITRKQLLIKGFGRKGEWQNVSI